MWLRVLLAACVIASSSAAFAAKKDRDKSPPPAPRKEKAEKKDAADQKGDSPPKEAIKRESKIEFDERVVQGQRAQGAVYLFQRAESKFGSLVRTPNSFRDRTVKSVFGE
jgi:hypothetical protein